MKQLAPPFATTLAVRNYGFSGEAAGCLEVAPPPSDRLVEEYAVRLFSIPDDADEFVTVMLKALRVLTQAEHVMISEREESWKVVRFSSSRTLADPLGFIEAEIKHGIAHPFWESDVGWFAGEARKSSETYSDQEFARLPLVHEVLIPTFGARYVLKYCFLCGGRVVTMTAYRSEAGDFSPLAVRYLRQLGAYVALAYRFFQIRWGERIGGSARLRALYPNLTLRQCEVLHWLVEGKSNDIIADLLAITKDGVKAHLKRIFTELGVENRQSAVAAALNGSGNIAPASWMKHNYYQQNRTGRK